MSNEIQYVREQIELEIQAMHQGLNGLAAGFAKHRFIEARSRRIGQLEDELATYVGKTQAIQISCQAYIQFVNGE